MEDEYLQRQGGWGEGLDKPAGLRPQNWDFRDHPLAAGESNQSVREDVDPERVVARHVDVDPQVKLVPADEVGLVKVPANHKDYVSA